MLDNGFCEEWFVAPSGADHIYDWFRLNEVIPQKGVGKFLRIGRPWDNLDMHVIRALPFDGVNPGVYVVTAHFKFVSGVKKGDAHFGKIVSWVGIDDFGNVEFFEYVKVFGQKGLSKPPLGLLKFFKPII